MRTQKTALRTSFLDDEYKNTLIAKWEQENAFLASVLQRECLNRKQYEIEVLEAIECD